MIGATYVHTPAQTSSDAETLRYLPVVLNVSAFAPVEISAVGQTEARELILAAQPVADGECAGVVSIHRGREAAQSALLVDARDKAPGRLAR